MTRDVYIVTILIPECRKDGLEARNLTVWYTGIIIRTCRRLLETITMRIVSIMKAMEKLKGEAQRATARRLQAWRLLRRRRRVRFLALMRLPITRIFRVR